MLNSEFEMLLQIQLVDFSTQTIYELKPFNPGAMKQGMQQLEKYKALFEKTFGGTWKTVLDTY